MTLPDRADLRHRHSNCSASSASPTTAAWQANPASNQLCGQSSVEFVEVKRMMEQSDSVQMFWKQPELIGRLISFLNLGSTLQLLQAHVMEKRTLQKIFSNNDWVQFIKRCLRSGGRQGGQDVKDLAKILKLLQLEDPTTFLLPLLDRICELSPKVSSSPFKQEHIAILCPACYTEPHIISTSAFLLLEEVEGALGTAVQSIQSLSKVGCDVAWRDRDAGWLAIASRMRRQREVVISINNVRFYLNHHTTRVFATLMRAQAVSFDHLNIGFREKLGDEGWQVTFLI